MKKKQAVFCDVECFDGEKVDHVQSELDRISFPSYSSLLKSIADENRLKIVYALSKCDEELCVCDVANILDITNANASRHLRLLYKNDVIQYRKEGKMSFYFIKNTFIKEMVLNLIDADQLLVAN